MLISLARVLLYSHQQQATKTSGDIQQAMAGADNRYRAKRSVLSNSARCMHPCENPSPASPSTGRKIHVGKSMRCMVRRAVPALHQ